MRTDADAEILIVDTDESLSRALSLFFRVQKINGNLTSVKSAEQAMDFLPEKEYDLILCDYWLPGMNGIDFFRSIHKLQANAKKLLVISYNNDDIITEDFGSQIDGIIRKPFTVGELEKLLIEGGMIMADEETKTEEKPKDKDALVDSVIRNHVLGSMGVGLVPIPLVDMVAISAVQLNMLRRMANIYEVPFSKDKVKLLVASMVGGGVPVVGASAVGSMIKSIPIVGQTIGMLTMPAIAGASTYAIGKIFVQHFASGGTFLNFNPEQVRGYYEKLFKEGEKVASELKKGDDSETTATSA